MTRIFLSVSLSERLPPANMDLNSTGASGYIGGDVLHQLLKSHPEYRVRALVRDASKGAAITKVFKQVEIVNGGLDDTDIIAQEAKEADIVIRLSQTVPRFYTAG